MLELALFASVSACLALPWLYGTFKRPPEPDPYDDPNNWGSQ